MLTLKDGYKVRLVPFAPEFGEKIFEWYYDVDYKFFFREFDAALSLEDCRRFDKILKGSLLELLMIVDKASGDPIGMITYSCLKRRAGVVRVGILLDKHCQHRALAIEALIIVGDTLFNRLGYNKLVVEYLASDTHIQRISEQGGFVREGVLVQEAIVDGERVDEVKYYLLKKTYLELYGGYFG